MKNIRVKKRKVDWYIKSTECLSYKERNRREKVVALYWESEQSDYTSIVKYSNCVVNEWNVLYLLNVYYKWKTMLYMNEIHCIYKTHYINLIYLTFTCYRGYKLNKTLPG